MSSRTAAGSPARSGGDTPWVILVNPPIYDFALYDLYLKPFGLLRVAEYLRRGGWDTIFVDALDYKDPPSVAALGRPRRKEDGTGKMFRSLAPLPPGLASLGRPYFRYGILPESLEQRLRDGGLATGGGKSRPPDLILVASGMTYWYPGVVEAVRLARKVYPRVPVAVGGVYAQLLPEHCARVTEADYVALPRAGAGNEEADRGGLENILPPLGFPLPEGGLPPAPSPQSQYWGDAAVLRINQGCPLACDYCASRRLSPRFQIGDPLAAADWVREAWDRGIQHFAFYDDALLSGKEGGFLPFLERILHLREGGRRPRFYLPNAVHIRGLDLETAGMMRRAGFQEIRMGFESSSVDFHAAHTRGGAKFRPDSFPETIRLLVEAGFSREVLSVYILAGLPGQEAQEVEDSILTALKEGVRVRLAEYSPVPGTDLWEESLRRCRYPIGEEPLFHNNSFLAMEWEGFTREDLTGLKTLARTGKST